MGLRDLYNQFEQTAAPLAATVIGSKEFGQLVSIVGPATKALKSTSNKLAARTWHTLNLPAGTDVQRLARQVGSLDREVRLLTVELEKARAKSGEVSRRGGRSESGSN